MRSFLLIAAGDFHTDAGLVTHGTVLGELQLDESLPIANLTSLLRTGRCRALDVDEAPAETETPADPPAPAVGETPVADPAPQDEPAQAEPAPSEPQDPPVAEDPIPEPTGPNGQDVADSSTLEEAGLAKKFADLYESELGITTVGQLRAHVADGGDLEDPDGIGPVTAKLVAKLIGV